MVAKDTRKNRKQLSPGSTDFTQEHPFSSLVSDQDASSNRVPTHTPVSRRTVLKTGLGAAVAATGIGTWLGLHADTTQALFSGTTLFCRRYGI